MGHKITTEWKGGMLFESDNPSGQKVLMDTISKNYTLQQGLSPKAMMLSALAGCSGVDIVEILEKMKVEEYGLKIEIAANLTEEHPRYYDKVQVDYHFFGSKLESAKINRAVALSVDKYCGVMEMFRQFSKVKTAIHLHNS